MTATMLIGGSLVAACSQSESSGTDTVDAPTTIDSTVPVPSTASTTEPPPTTVAPATTIEATTTTATPATTEPPTTTEPPATTEAPATTAPDGPPAATPASAYVTLDPALVEIDLLTGEVVREIADFFTGEGVFRGSLRLDPGGRSLWFSEAYEDGWYGCESSVGSYGVVDLETGEIRILGPGGGAEPSPNGEFSVVVSSEVCVPDPQQPDIWVLTPSDRVVVRQLASGDEREYVTSPTPENYEAPSAVEWAGFSPAGNLLVLTVDGTVRNVDLDGSDVLQDHPAVLTDVEGFPIGATADALIVQVIGDEGNAELYSVSAESGERTLLASSERFFDAGVDVVTGEVLVAGFAEITVAEGAPVTVLTVPDGEFVGALDW